MGEVMIPPWVRPESPETLRWIDDATSAFAPAFGRGMTQRGIWADPRWGLRRRYRGLRADERAAILACLNERRGQFNSIRVTPHTPIRGSFVTSELLSNNTFANGTTGWGAQSQIAATVSDRVYRATRTANTSNQSVLSNTPVTVVQYAPLVARLMSVPGRGSVAGGIGIGSSQHSADIAAVAQNTYGLLNISAVPSSTSVSIAVTDGGVAIAGDYFSIPYVSLARCALVDYGANNLVQSDAFSNASWTKNRCSASGTDADPTNASAANRIIEDSTASNSHFVEQLFSVGSSAQDISFGVALKAGPRTWGALSLQEGTGSTSVTAFFNLSTGVVGTTSTGANWSNLRTFVADLGNGWYACYIVVRKTNAATSIGVRIFLASADNTLSYSGDGTSYIRSWRATVVASSVPTRLSQTTGSFTSGTAPTGAAMYTKGWPANSNGLLLRGDWFEWQGELKQLTAPVNSDSAGLAYLQFRPGLSGTPADGDPIIVYEPFGRFVYPGGTAELENQFGIYGDCEMNLEEIYA